MHTRSKLESARSASEAGRLARASFVLYLAAAEAIVHQAAVELGRPELAPLLSDPSRPLPLADAWRLLPAIIAEPTDHPGNGGFDPRVPPWPQFSELLAARVLWAYPGPPALRRAYYTSPSNNGQYDPLPPHAIPPQVDLLPDQLVFPRTGLPRDPYAFRPHHLDTAKGVLDAAIEALDRRMGGALTRDQRHRCEPVRVVSPAPTAIPPDTNGHRKQTT